MPGVEFEKRMSNEVNRSAQCLGIGLLATGGMEVALQMYLNSFVNLKFSEPLEVAALYDSLRGKPC